MATWALSPQYKKSAIEKMFFYKDGSIISIEQGFRWATFKADADERPLTDEELKNEDGYELASFSDDGYWEMWEMIDGCWLEISAERDVSDEDLEAFESAWEENSYEGVEELGWSNDDTEYYYHGPLELTNEDTGEVFKGEPDEIPEVPADVTTEELEMTDWFPASVNPVRVGEYEILTTEAINWPFPSKGYWDGKKWDLLDHTVAQWRGLAKEPK
jgi:hypothetical protein